MTRTFSQLPLSILVGDDVKMNRKTARLMLKKAFPNAHIDEASNAAELLSKLTNHGNEPQISIGHGPSAPCHYDMLFTDEDYGESSESGPATIAKDEGSRDDLGEI